MMRALLIVLFAVPVYAQTGPCATVTGPLLPNLVAYASVSKQGAFISTETFTHDHCSVQEGEITEGTHKLLRFPSRTGNIGSVDLYVGNPANCPDLFEFSACHFHHHIHGYTLNLLWTPTGYEKWVAQRDLNQAITGSFNQVLLMNATAGGELVSGRKHGFCLIDTVRLSGTPAYTRNEFGLRVTTSHFQSCYDDQGLTAGYGDEYGPLLDGQYIVVDGLQPGWYVIEILANPDHLLPESNYTDNSSAARVKL